MVTFLQQSSALPAGDSNGDEEMEDQESDTYDVEVESIYDENDYEDDDEDVPTDEDELEEDPLLPVAIDGPFTIDEIRNMVKKGII